MVMGGRRSDLSRYVLFHTFEPCFHNSLTWHSHGGILLLVNFSVTLIAPEENLCIRANSVFFY